MSRLSDRRPCVRQNDAADAPGRNPVTTPHPSVQPRDLIPVCIAARFANECNLSPTAQTSRSERVSSISPVRHVLLGPSVPIRPFLEHNHSFGPEDIASLSAAFESALSKLGLVARDDPATMAVAKLIIELAKEGERDPERLCALALKQLSKQV